MIIVEGVHVLVGAGLVDLRAINVGLTHEWGAQRLVYCIDSPSWQTSSASMLAQQGELNHEVGNCGQMRCRQSSTD